jgi:phospholipid/cholesterol/gamma-HCH transport system permease protein
MLTYPFVIAISMFLGILGAYTAAVLGGFVGPDDFVQGLQDDFEGFHLTYAFFKTFFFAFILATVPAYHGYYMKGGALEVGQASTTSFVWTSVAIIITNYVVTQLLLS